MIIADDRTPEERKTHYWLVVGTDPFMSGWGQAQDGVSYAAWACRPEHRNDCFGWVDGRGDMLRVREVIDGDGPNVGKYRPSARGHLHIYVFTHHSEGAR